MPDSIISPVILNCNEEDFVLIKKHIAEFCLDDNDLNISQFLVAKYENKIIGFGRLRHHNGCDELCSLGVLEDCRRQGVGSALSKALIGKSKAPLFTVTIIPEFFARFGFSTTDHFPGDILSKLNYCTTSLAVPETYVAMRYL